MHLRYEIIIGAILTAMIIGCGLADASENLIAEYFDLFSALMGFFGAMKTRSRSSSFKTIRAARQRAL